MSLFYKPKHHTPRFTISFQWFHDVMNFIYDETIWYIKWWGHLVVNFFHKLYQFGDWLLAVIVDFIDKHDKFWDSFESKEKRNVD